MKNWEKYELQVFNKFKSEYPDHDIRRDQKIDGKFSKQKRQIDILISGSFVGQEIKIAIDCKNYSKKVDVKTVKFFIGMLDDIGINKGVIITNMGYTKEAKNRVNGYTKDVELKIVEYEKLDDFKLETFYSNEYCESCGMVQGQISWYGEEQLVHKKHKVSILIGECERCAETFYKCIECENVMDKSEMNLIECGCGIQFEVKEEWIRVGETRSIISIKN